MPASVAAKPKLVRLPLYRRMPTSRERGGVSCGVDRLDGTRSPKGGGGRPAAGYPVRALLFDDAGKATSRAASQDAEKSPSLMILRSGCMGMVNEVPVSRVPGAQHAGAKPRNRIA